MALYRRQPEGQGGAVVCDQPHARVFARGVDRPLANGEVGFIVVLEFPSATV